MPAIQVDLVVNRPGGCQRGLYKTCPSIGVSAKETVVAAPKRRGTAPFPTRSKAATPLANRPNQGRAR